MIKRLYKWFRFLVLLAWVLLLAVIGAWILTENDTLISVRLFGFESAEQTLGLVVFATTIAGWCLGVFTTTLAGWNSSFWQARKLRATQKELDRIKLKQQTP